MHWIDYALILSYPLLLIYLGFRGRGKEKDNNLTEHLLAGRMLTLPAFVASLVSTWYGGILGIGEYTYRYGLANWFVFGLPYYVGAFLFAIFLAKKARQAESLSIPATLEKIYGRKTALLGAGIIFLMTVPGAYLLIVGVLCQSCFGWPLWLGLTIAALFSGCYIIIDGFRSVVRTDIMQTVAMFVGFIILFCYLVSTYGGWGFLSTHLPEQHLTWNGGQTLWAILTWYVIALGTLCEPAFFQRCYAAKTPTVARNGILVSILLWACFDFLSTSCGLYARALLPDLADPVASFPTLATQLLPVGILGLFGVALFATAQSTLDSYLFISAQTLGYDLIGKIKNSTPSQLIRYTQWGVLLAALLALLCVLLFHSVVDIWFAFGSIGTPALLVPIFFGIVGKRRIPGQICFWTIISSALVSAVWYCSQFLTNDQTFWLGLWPIFPGLALSLSVYFLTSTAQQERLPN